MNGLGQAERPITAVSNQARQMGTRHGDRIITAAVLQRRLIARRRPSLIAIPILALKKHTQV